MSTCFAKPESEMGTDRLKRIADFLFEAGMLARLPRTGFAFLGSGDQSIAEHLHRTAVLGYVLATLEDADVGKVLAICLFHDLPETRTSDLNNVSKRYTHADAARALEDQTRDLPFGEEVKELVEEFEAQGTREAQIARDADQLELLLSLKEQLDQGNRKAERWVPYVLTRLQTETAKRLATTLLETDSDGWWFPGQQ